MSLSCGNEKSKWYGLVNSLEKSQQHMQLAGRVRSCSFMDQEKKAKFVTLFSLFYKRVHHTCKTPHWLDDGVCTGTFIIYNAMNSKDKLLGNALPYLFHNLMK